jgi:hypothetical protein
MKQLMLFFSGLILATATQAQITLTSSSYPSSVIGTDSLKMTTATSTFPALTPATNGSWDMSIVTDSAPVFYAYRVNPDTSFCQFADSNFYTISTYTYQGNIQSSITSAGLIDYGIDIQSAQYPISAGDTFYILAQHILFSSPYTVIKFPATMRSPWSSSYESDFNYQLTYPPLYTHAPGLVKAFYSVKDTVVGWGKMRVKDMTGSPSLWFPVLQAQTTVTVVDSYYVDSAQPPAPFFTALGVTQGQVTKTYYQDYVRPEEVTPFAQVQFTDGTFSTPSQATTHVQRLTESAVPTIPNEAGINIYPNPVSDGVITVTLPATGGAWSYELTDITGRKVQDGLLQPGGNQAQVILPSSLIDGLYYLKVNNDGRQVSIKPIDVIK